MGGLTWTGVQNQKLHVLYPHANWREILAAFPNRNQGAIRRHAQVLGLRRPKVGVQRAGPYPDAHPLLRQLCLTRQRKNLRREAVAEQIGITVTAFGRWERGASVPRWDYLMRWCDVLGVVLVVRENGPQLSQAGRTALAAQASQFRGG